VTFHPDRSAAGDGFEPDELLALARLDLRKGDVQAALAKLKAATAAARPPDHAFSLCGQIYLQLGLPDRAQAMFLKYLALHPGAPDETHFLGLVHFGAGRAAEALKLWNEVLHQNPSYSPSLLYRAIVSAQQGQLAAARTDVDLLMKSTPVESPYFKPAKGLMEQLDAGLAATAPAQPVGPAGAAPALTAHPAAFAGNAYVTERS
jgi:tetratricopeptide (TPR) repeat protein